MAWRRWRGGLALGLALGLLGSGLVPSRAEAAGFTDVRGHWAEAAIERMAAKGVVTGYSSTEFRPDQMVTRVQAIVMLVRTLGWESSARARSSLPARFTDRDVPAYAIGYVAEATERGLIQGGNLSRFNADAGATRLQVALWLLRGLGLQAEAEQQAGSLRDGYSDTGSLSEVDRAALALLARRNLMRGGTDNRFRPYDRMTRAEMATLMAAADRATQNALDAREVSGRFAGPAIPSSGGLGLTLARADGTRETYVLQPDYTVLRADRRSNLSALAMGEAITLVLGAGERVVLVDAGGPSTVVALPNIPATGTPFTVSATLEEIDDGPVPLLIVQVSGGTRRTYPLASGAVIRVDGEAADLGDLEEGMEVTLTGNGGQVTRIEAAEEAETLRGELRSIVALQANGEPARGAVTPAERLLSVTRYDEDGEEDGVVQLRAPEDLPIRRSGEAAGWADLRIRDQLTLRVRGGRVVSLEAQPGEYELEDVTLERIEYAANPILHVETEDGDKLSLPLAEDYDLERDGDRIGLTSLMPGETLQLRVEKGKVTRIEAEDVDDRIEGVLDSITLGNVPVLRITDEDGKERNLEVASGVEVEIDGDDDAELLDLKPGYRLDLRLENGRVERIEAEKGARFDAFSGTVRYVDRSADTFILQEFDSNVTREVRVDDDVLFIAFDEVSDRGLRLLGQDDRVVVIGTAAAGGSITASTVILYYEGDD